MTNHSKEEKALTLWMDSLRSDNTRIAYSKSINHLRTTFNQPLFGLSSGDIQAWVDAMTQDGFAAKTCCMYAAAASSFYTFAKRFGYVTENPVTGVNKPIDKPVEEIYWFNMTDLKKLFSVIDQSTVIGRRDYALFLSYVLLGRRNSEIRNLKFGDFQMYDGLLYYFWSGKGKLNEKAICPPEVTKAITEYLRASGRNKSARPDDYVFIRTQGTDKSPLSIVVVDVILKQYARKAGLPTERIHIHCLRHTAVMLRLNAGESIENIAKLLGHSSVSITEDNYVHVQEAV